MTGKVKSATVRLNATETLMLQRGLQRLIQRLEELPGEAETMLEYRMALDIQDKLTAFAARHGWL